LTGHDPRNRKIPSCVTAIHHFALSSGYYQNASRIGKRNVAAYPQAQLSYGIAENTELFYDAPSEIAQSALSIPSYFMTQPGYGLDYETVARRGVAYSITAERSPPNGALANPRLLPTYEVSTAGYWPVGSIELGAQAGSLWFTQRTQRSDHSSPLFGISATHALGDKMLVSAGVDVQSCSFFSAGAQSSGTLELQRLLSPRVLLDAKIGSTFNASARSKPHYIGFGFAIR
jgi:hypothetical protein